MLNAATAAATRMIRFTAQSVTSYGQRPQQITKPSTPGLRSGAAERSTAVNNKLIPGEEGAQPNTE
jgi:hypothetical protein